MTTSGNDIETEEEPRATALGLDLNAPLHALGVPIEALVIAKVFQDGEPSYVILSTEDLTLVESLGMIEFARMMTRMGFAMADDDDDDDDGEDA